MGMQLREGPSMKNNIGFSLLEQQRNLEKGEVNLSRLNLEVYL